MTKTIGFLMTVVTLAGSGVATAQSTSEGARVRISVNGGLQAKSETLTSSSTFTVYDEQGTVSSSLERGNATAFDLGVGIRVWRQLSAGLTLQRAASSGDATASGAAPHPVYYSRPRSFTAAGGSLDRSEQAVHISLGWTMPVGKRAEVTVSGGPSQFRVSQGVVSNVSLSETTAPYTTVNATVVTGDTKGSALGVHVGADAAYLITDRVGLGAFMRYATGSAEVSVGNTRVSTSAGGLQVGAGLRFRF